ncbi:MAG: glycosyltransferase family 1 protein [Deltaproteobacteria bacterium]|nr:glycosyltransferase family 1 protein [Deltaproteobacteria bacterium]
MVLNENLFNGVTTRMFEGMASGTMLLTEKAGNGLNDLFTPGEDLADFGPYDLFDQIEHYLINTKERERIAVRGREKVVSSHDIRHRAEKLISLMEHARPETGVQEEGLFFRQQGKVLFLAAMRWPDHNGRSWLNRAEILLKRAEQLNRADKDTLLYLGLIQKLRYNHQKAVAYLENAASSGSVRAMLASGFLTLERSNRKAAQAYFLEAIHKADGQNIVETDIFKTPSDNHILSADQHFILGRILEKRGYDLTPGFSRLKLGMPLWNAFEHYLQAVKLHPKHLQALTRLGRLLTRYGAYTEAYQFLARAAEIDPQAAKLIQEANIAGRRGYILM